MGNNKQEMYASVVTVLLGLTATVGGQDYKVAGDKICSMTQYDNKCVRCIAANGEFFTRDGVKGKCAVMKSREKLNFVDAAEKARVCFAAAPKTKKECASDFQHEYESDKAYVEGKTCKKVEKKAYSNAGDGTTSFFDCKGNNWRKNIGDSSLDHKARAKKCKENADYCNPCRDITLTARKHSLDKDVLPCESERDVADGVDEAGQPKTKKHCDRYQAWTSYNHTIQLGDNQACRFKVESEYKETDFTEKTWLPSFGFGENEDEDVLVIAKEYWPAMEKSGAKFWTPDSAKADNGWLLLQGRDLQKDGEPMVYPAGNVPIEKNDEG